MATLTDVLTLLETEFQLAGSAAVWARSKGLAPGYVSDVIHGRKEPGKKILDALGLERVITYRRMA